MFAELDEYLGWEGRGAGDWRRFCTRRHQNGRNAITRALVPGLDGGIGRAGDPIFIATFSMGFIFGVSNLRDGTTVRFVAWRFPLLMLAWVALICAVYRTPLVLSVTAAILIFYLYEALRARSTLAKLEKNALARVMLGARLRSGQVKLPALPPVSLTTPQVEAAFKRAFVPGAYFAEHHVSGRIEVGEIGRLALASGRLLTLDPRIGMPGTPASVPAGDWPVEVARVQTGHEARVGYARVRFGGTAIVGYRRAGRGRRQGEFDVDTGLDVDVSSGIAAFADAAAFTAALAHATALAPDDPVSAPLDLAPGAMISFEAGLGAGTYPAYFELAADGTIGGVIIDFGLAFAEDMNVAAARDEAAGLAAA